MIEARRLTAPCSGRECWRVVLGHTYILEEGFGSFGWV
jgi:hypothetical protein